MAKKSVIFVSSLIIIAFTLIVIIPIQLISVNLLPYRIIDKSLYFPFKPNSPFPIEKLCINVDEGDVEIRYIDPNINLDYYSMIEVNLMIIGVNLGGKSYDDYLNISSNNSNPLVNFTIKIISDDWYKDSLWVKKELKIIVNLRKDIIFDISANVKEGNVDLSIPYMVSVSNILINVSNGNIYYDFESSSIQGNITGITNKGDLKLKSYNVEYTENVNWLLNSIGGIMNIEIYQYKEMGANITGNAMIIDGVLNLFYKDNTANIGAIFFFPLLSGSPTLPQKGFNTIFQSAKTWFISFDFPTLNNYNLTFYITDPCNRCRFIELHSD